MSIRPFAFSYRALLRIRLAPGDVAVACVKARRGEPVEGYSNIFHIVPEFSCPNEYYLSGRIQLGRFWPVEIRPKTSLREENFMEKNGNAGVDNLSTVGALLR